MYEEMKKKIIEFISESKISAYDLQRIAKDLCRCGHCKFFVQHFNSKGTELDFGHCMRGNIPRSKKPYDTSCGYWEDNEQ